jgi:hypothetical protein
LLALRELQRQFSATLFAGRDGGELLEEVVADGIDAARRLDIYRNNLQEGFRKALALEFPVIERLVGNDYFHQLARDFLAAHPSRCGDLHHIGAPLPSFLTERFSDSDYAYLPDVARLEWAVEEAGIAADEPPFDLTSLQSIGAEDCARLRFALHPACRLVRSRYPILQIWRANQPELPGEEIIDLGQGGENVLVHRTFVDPARGGQFAAGVELLGLEASTFAFLEALAAGFDLAAALEASRHHDEQFDVGTALRRFIHTGALTRAHLPETLRT